MNRSKALAAAAVVAGIALLAVAVVYFVVQEKSLPSFIPGRDTSSSGHHVKHGIAALALALGCFAFAWFRSAPPKSAG